jgi:hypothetical protein
MPLVAAAAAGLGALAAAQLSVLGQLRVTGIAARGAFDVDLLVYSGIVALVLALVAWHRFPRRSWAALVIAGAVCTVPNLVLLLAPDALADWMRDPYFVLDAAARPLLLVGLLGAATAVWRAGARRAGAVLLGTTGVLPPLASFVVAGYVLDMGAVVPVIGLVLVAVAIVVPVVAVVVTPSPAEPEPRPEWRVTAAAAVAGLAPAVYLWWGAPERPETGGELDAYIERLAEHNLVVGLVVLGIGLLAGFAAGSRVFVTGVAAGVLLGAVSLLSGPAVVGFGDVPAAVPAVVALVALALAIACAVPRYRLMVGVPGLAVLVVGLLVLYQVFSADDPILDADVVTVLTPVLLAVTVVAVLSVLASLGMVVVSSGAAPAVFAGVVGAVAAGVAGIGSYFSFDPPDEIPASLASYPAVMAFLVVAGLLTLYAHQRWQRGDHV